MKINVKSTLVIINKKALIALGEYQLYNLLVRS